MPKLSDIEIVERSYKTVEIQVPGGKLVPVGLQLLTVSQRAEVYAKAKAAAKARGAENWDPDDPTCSLELYVETVAAAAIDVDNPERPFTTADELRKHRAIGQESLGILYAAYERYEATVANLPTSLDPADIATTCLQLASGDTSFLDRSGPGMQLTLLRFLAVHWLESMGTKSPSTTDSDSDSSSDSSKSGETS
jgi:hypothetical protein